MEWYGYDTFSMVPMAWYVKLLQYGVVGRLASLAPNLHAPAHSRGWYGTDWQGNKIQRKTQMQMQIGIQIPSSILHLTFTCTNGRGLLGNIHV